MADSLALNNDGDIDIIEGRTNTITGQEAFRQSVLTRLKTFLGEWFLNTSVGVPYRQKIFQKGISPDQINSLFKIVIVGTPGAEKLTGFDFDYIEATREYTLTFTVRYSGENVTFENIVI